MGRTRLLGGSQRSFFGVLMMITKRRQTQALLSDELATRRSHELNRACASLCQWFLEGRKTRFSARSFSSSKNDLAVRGSGDTDKGGKSSIKHTLQGCGV